MGGRAGGRCKRQEIAGVRWVGAREPLEIPSG